MADTRRSDTQGTACSIDGARLSAEIAAAIGDGPTRRLLATDAAIALLTKLSELHGGLMMHQSGGCCDGSAPMCYPVGDYKIGQRDVLMGEITLPDELLPPVRVWIGGDQFEVWKHTQLIIDVVPGRGAGFSLEAPEGVRFLSRSRTFTDEENALLEASPPQVGADFE